MKNATKGKVLTGVGYGVATVAPLVATASQFPVFVEKSADATLSGVFILVCCVVAVPLLLYVKRLRANNSQIVKPPTALTFWILVLVGCLALEAIITQFKIIALAGIGGASVAEILFKSAKKVALKPDEKEAIEKATGQTAEQAIENAINEVANG